MKDFILTSDPAYVAIRLTENERRALRSLPAQDRGHMSEELWWAYYSLLDAGLLTTAGNFLMVPTKLVRSPASSSE